MDRRRREVEKSEAQEMLRDFIKDVEGMEIAGKNTQDKGEDWYRQAKV